MQNSNKIVIAIVPPMENMDSSNSSSYADNPKYPRITKSEPKTEQLACCGLCMAGVWYSVFGCWLYNCKTKQCCSCECCKAGGCCESNDLCGL